jgi:hypothetical protein
MARIARVEPRHRWRNSARRFVCGDGVVIASIVACEEAEIHRALFRSERRSSVLHNERVRIAITRSAHAI